MCKLSLFLFFFSNLTLSINQICILVHGTWGTSSDWHNSGHPFYQAIQEELTRLQIKLITFKWCGTLSYEKRKLAGANLANLIDSYPPITKFIIIAHSHGGNVGILASQYLQQAEKISSFYALGTPIDPETYMPNMYAIKNFYNIFSFGDLYQTVLGMHDRFLPKGQGIYNLNIEINNQKPQHEELHCETIAKWLMQIPSYLKNFSCENHFFGQFYEKNRPIIKIDHNFESKLTRDLKLHSQLHAHLTDFTNGRNASLNFSRCDL